MHAPLETKSEENKPDAATQFSAREFGAVSGLPIFLQTKLNVNRPGDVFEQEADHVASLATNGSSHSCPACGGTGGNGHICPTCQAQDHKVQLKHLPGASGVSSTSASIDTSGGSPLSPNVRGRVEPVLGYDLSHVRVHTDSRASEGASALQAKAFTHQNHIWLGAHQSSDDVDLMSHEITHVVQQGAGRTPSQSVQRRETTNDGEAPKARLFSKIEEETGTKIAPAKAQEPAQGQPGAPGAAPAPAAAVPKPMKPARPALTREQQDAKSKIDPGDKQRKRGESESDAHPDIDRPAQAQPKAEAGARETKQQVDEPPKPIAGEKDTAGKKKEKGHDKGDKKGAAAHAAPGDAAFAAADSIPQPNAAPPIAIPAPVMPMDAAGQPLPPNPASDTKVASLAIEAQMLRDEGFRLRQAAAEMRGNAHSLRGNMQMVSSGVGNSEAITTAFHDNSKYRHDAAGQADSGLGISDQKAATVAEQAPRGVEKANEQKAKSGEVAGESSSLAGESAGQTGDDEEANAKAQENSGKMNKVSSDIGTIDNAVGQAQSAATTLVQDAAQAKTTNAATRTKLADVNTTLAHTDVKLEQMDGHNAAARSQLAALASGPDEMLAQAQALDDQGLQLIETSRQIETDLAAAQANYAQAMKSIPKEEEPAESEGAVQREPEEGAGQPDTEAVAAAGKPEEKSKDIDLTESLPEWLSGEKKPSEEERERAYQENENRRQAEIKEIDNSKEGGFDKLSQGDKALMALKLTGRNLFGGISKISWPGWGKVGEGAAKMVIGIFDPRSALTGALSGVNMIINASVQFFKQPSWGGLLKLAADIATGITIILGSIVALAGTIAAIMTAIAILSFGTLAPICGPVIAFCATVMSTVGGWTFWAGLVALGLQALVFLKDLYAASTAKTAAELQKSSDAMSADAKNAGNAALQAGMGKLAQFGGRAMQAEIAEVGGTQFARNIAKKSLLGEAGQGFKGGGLKGFGKALGKGITKRAVGAGRNIKQAVTHPIQTIKDLRQEMKAAGEKKPISFKDGTSKEFLVGPSKEATAAASEAKVAGAAKVSEEVHPMQKADAAKAEAHLKSTASKEGPHLTPDELAKEKTIADGMPKKKISDGDFKEKAELPNGHDVKYAEDGSFCRFSGKPKCGGFFGKNATAADIEKSTQDIAKAAKLGTTAEEVSKGAEDVKQFFRTASKTKEGQELASQVVSEIKATGKLSDETAAEFRSQLTPSTTEGKITRYDATNKAQVEKLRRQGPTKPSVMTDQERELWPQYERYYDRRLDEIEAKLTKKTSVAELPEGPRDFETYAADRRVHPEFQRGTEFNKSTQEQIKEIKDEAGITAAEPEVAFTTKKGDSTRADHMISYEDPKTGRTKLATVSNKSRTFSGIVEGEGEAAWLNEGRLRAQVEEDVDELINKYSGRLESRSLQPGFEGLYGEKITVNEVFMHYHVEPIVSVPGYSQSEIQRLIKSIAERRAFARRKNLLFYLIFEVNPKVP